MTDNEQNEYKHWPKGEENAKEAQEAKLSEETVAKLSSELSELGEEVFADPSAERFGQYSSVVQPERTEVFDAFHQAFGEDLDETNYQPPFLERIPVEDSDSHIYGLQLKHKNSLGDERIIDYVFNESDGTLVKYSAQEDVDPLLRVERADTEDKLEKLKDRSDRTYRGIGMLLQSGEVPEALQEEMRKLDDLQSNLDNLKENTGAEFNFMTPAVDEATLSSTVGEEVSAEVESGKALRTQAEVAEQAYEAQKLRLMETATEFGEVNDWPGLAALAASYTEMSKHIKELEQKHAGILRRVGEAESEELARHQEVATEQNGITDEFLDIVRALKSES